MLHAEIVPEIHLLVTPKTAPNTMNSPTVKNARQVNIQSPVIRSVTHAPLDVILKSTTVLAEIVRKDTKVWIIKRMIHHIAFVVIQVTTKHKLQNSIVFRVFQECTCKKQDQLLIVKIVQQVFIKNWLHNLRVMTVPVVELPPWVAVSVVNV